MSINFVEDGTLDDGDRELMRKGLAAKSRGEIDTLRRFIGGLIAFPGLRKEKALLLVLSFLEEAGGGAHVKERASTLKLVPPSSDGDG